MKKITLLFTVFASQINFAQQTSDVGSLKIINDGVHHTLFNSGGMARMDMGFDGTKGFIKFGAHTGNGQRENILYMRGSDGNVGIGTDSPDSKLVVNGDAKFKHNLFISGLSGGYTTGDNPSLFFGVNSDFAKINIPFGDKMILSSYHGYTFNTSFNGTTALPALTIGITGNVGIGITNPNNKLDVKGIIHSQEVKVDMSGWSDFVFKKEYNLPTLEEVEKHIAEKGHLENIPSEKEVLKNGINLGEMNSKLLQKIEEMTLYMIEQNKRMNKLEKENQDLKKEVNSIRNHQKNL